MSFENAQVEIRDRFSEANSLLLFLHENGPGPLKPTSNNIKSIKGLWLVSIYSAVERSVNTTIECALEVISSHENRSIDCIPSLHSIFHYRGVKSVNECSRNKIFDNSKSLFESVLSESVIKLTDNPLAESLQNVDANSMSWLLGLFGASNFSISPASTGRVNSLRERRNAVAHGRESAAEVGERYTLEELSNIYNACDEVVTAFFLNLKDHCIHQKYLKSNSLN